MAAFLAGLVFFECFPFFAFRGRFAPRTVTLTFRRAGSAASMRSTIARIDSRRIVAS